MSEVKIYLVGGAVRDELMGEPVKDRDWVVEGATEQYLVERGYQSVGRDFPVFLHPKTKEEYALARTERKTAPGYHGFAFNTNQNVSIEEDLLRRDITINAMAKNKDGRLVDPYYGQRDLKNKILRHVSPAFREDPVRILRIARFAARFHSMGFTIAPETICLMREMVSSGEVDALVPERIWQETRTALAEISPAQYFLVLRECHALQKLFPEIADLFGVPQPSRYHQEIDSGWHTLMVLEEACQLSQDPCTRYAALVHDLGKATSKSEHWPRHRSHETRGLDPIKTLCRRLKVPRAYEQLALKVCEHHLKLHRAQELRPTTLLKLLLSVDAFRKPERFHQFLLCCQADATGRRPQNRAASENTELLKALRDRVVAIDIRTIVAQGLKGEDLMNAIHDKRLEQIAVFKREYRT